MRSTLARSLSAGKRRSAREGMRILVLLFSLLIPTPARAYPTLSPLAVGKTWTYEVTNVGFSTICAPGDRTEEVLAIETVDGQDAFKIRGYCGYVGHMRTDGLKQWGWFGAENRWYLYLDEPEPRRTWEEFRAFARWEELGQYAGKFHTFENCFRKLRLLAYTDVSIFCADVGMVYHRNIDLSGTGWEAHLRSYVP
jgi:hypothetical protein